MQYDFPPALCSRERSNIIIIETFLIEFNRFSNVSFSLNLPISRRKLVLFKMNFYLIKTSIMETAIVRLKVKISLKILRWISNHIFIDIWSAPKSKWENTTCTNREASKADKSSSQPSSQPVYSMAACGQGTIHRLWARTLNINTAHILHSTV